MNVDFNNAIGISVSVVLGTLGNALYFQSMKKELTTLKEKNGGVLPEEVLIKAGGTSWKGVGIAVLMCLVYIALIITLYAFL